MPDGPVVTTETRKRQREAHDTVTHDIKDAVEDFISRLHDIAKKHEHNLPYVMSLAGIAGYKKVSNIFCGMTLQEENSDKENGYKMTLPQLLKERSNELRTKFSELSNTEKEVLVTRHLQSKAERIDTPKKISNIAVSKAKGPPIGLSTQGLGKAHQQMQHYRWRGLLFQVVVMVSKSPKMALQRCVDYLHFPTGHYAHL
ncbi:hypothetical protein V8E52_002009 [Russula decolorans]